MQTVNTDELLTSIFEKQIAICDLADQLANEFDDIKGSDRSKAVAIVDLAGKQKEHLNELESKLDSIENLEQEGVDFALQYQGFSEENKTRASIEMDRIELEHGNGITDSVDFKAALTFKQVEKGEEDYQKQVKNIGVTRRALFAFLSKDKKELIEIVKDDEGVEAIMEIIEVANTNIEYLENVLSLMKTARNRLLLVMAEVHGDR